MPESTAGPGWTSWLEAVASSGIQWYILSTETCWFRQLNATFWNRINCLQTQSICLMSTFILTFCAFLLKLGGKMWRLLFSLVVFTHCCSFSLCIWLHNRQNMRKRQFNPPQKIFSHLKKKKQNNKNSAVVPVGQHRITHELPCVWVDTDIVFATGGDIIRVGLSREGWYQLLFEPGLRGETVVSTVHLSH